MAYGGLAFPNKGGAGIGGGYAGSGGNVTIEGGTVIAKAGFQGETGSGCRAIGPGAYNYDYGTLTIGDKMMVQAGADEDYERIFTAGERVNACWYRTSARIEPCTHDEVTYTISGTGADDTHTKHCKYCTTLFAPETHAFDTHGRCVVCGARNISSHIRIYLPKKGGDGTYDGMTYSNDTTYQMVPSTAFNLPGCPVIVPGLEFAGWEESSATEYTIESPYTTADGTIREAGEEYTITGDVTLIARYKVLDIILLDDDSSAAESNSAMLYRYRDMQAPQPSPTHYVHIPEHSRSRFRGALRHR